MDNTKVIHIYSSGGVGDTLIVALKIDKLKNYEKQQGNTTMFYWDHAERHECHRNAISEIMKKTVGEDYFKCEIQPEMGSNPEHYIKEKCKSMNGTYLDTKIMGITSPYLDFKIGEDFIISWEEKLVPHIVVNMLAGRTYNTRREVNVKVVHQLAKEFPKKRVVLLGPEMMEYLDNEFIQYEGRVYNATGHTDTIIDALSFINGCCLFVGQDGVLAYYSMMLRKPTIVHYHMPSLIQHYFNQNWAYHSIALFGGGNVLESLDLNNNEIIALLDIAKKYERRPEVKILCKAGNKYEQY